MTTTLRFGPYEVELSSANKVLFPDDGITKGELVQYYKQVSKIILPYLRGRPLTLHRFPDGIESDGFYQQNAPDHFPEWIETCEAPRAAGKGEPVQHILCRNQATLVYLANLGTITLHGWASRTPKLEHPDRMIFDLDPSTAGFDAVRLAARQVAALMEDLGLTPFAMTTGSRGLHVVAPLRANSTFDEVRSLAKDMAALLAQRHDDALTIEQRKNKRRGRIYLDVMRNAYGQTAVMPYAVRALPGAPVATPLSQDELHDSRLEPRAWTIQNIFRRLGQKEDPWKKIRSHATSLATAHRALNEKIAR